LTEFRNIIFYNRNHNGDVFESREFVKAFLKIVPAHAYYYLHSNSERLLLDIDNLTQIRVKRWSGMTPERGLLSFGVNKNVFINTWIGNGKYGCLVETNYDMYNEALHKLGYHPLPDEPKDYLPVIDYSKFDTIGIDNFMRIAKWWEGMVLVDNGNVLSLQANNFDFTPVLTSLSKQHPGKLFITTSPTYCREENIWWTGDIIHSPYDNDLMEISYLSRFCDIIVGRNSAPFVFSATKENLNSDKTFISFCYEARVATFHVNQSIKSKQIWSGATSEGDVFRVINNEINEYYS
jgi:hypothetical protein